MGDAQHCPCGYRGPMSSEAPPFWEVNGQTWHWDCLVAAMPDRRDELDAYRERYLAERYRPWVGRIRWAEDSHG